MNNFAFDPLPTNRVPTVTKTGVLTGWNINDFGEADTIGTAPGTTPPVLSMVWDGLGRLKSASIPSVPAQTYVYDPNGLRISLKDTVDATRNRKYVYMSGEKKRKIAWRDAEEVHNGGKRIVNK